MTKYEVKRYKLNVKKCMVQYAYFFWLSILVFEIVKYTKQKLFNLCSIWFKYTTLIDVAATIH